MTLNPWGGSNFGDTGSSGAPSPAQPSMYGNFNRPMGQSPNQGLNMALAGNSNPQSIGGGYGNTNTGYNYTSSTTQMPTSSGSPLNSYYANPNQPGIDQLGQLYSAQSLSDTSHNNADTQMQQMMLGLSNHDTGLRYGMLGNEAGVELNAALRDPRFAQQAFGLQNQLLNQQLGSINLNQQQAGTEYQKGKFGINSAATGQGSYFSPDRQMNQNWLGQGYQNQLAQFGLQRQGITTQRGLAQNDLDKQLAAFGDQAAIARLKVAGYGQMNNNAQLEGAFQGQQLTANNDWANANDAYNAALKFYDTTGNFLPPGGNSPVPSSPYMAPPGHQIGYGAY